MLSFLIWYLAVTLIGWISLPLAYRLLPALFDRGYTLTRPLGLLGWGFIFWLLASLGILQNNAGGVFLALLLLAGLSLWAGWPDRFAGLLGWLREQRRLIVASELLFLFAFAAWAFVRAANPDISGTEKPMEEAFLNAILRSPRFPPHDPWLSGYAISYYYFGYVIVAMLARLTAIPTGVAFNLALGMLFGLTALGSYGVVYNLLGAWGGRGGRAVDTRRLSLALPLLAPFFILLVSNLEGILDVLHSAGVFWTQSASGTWSSPFWSWLNIQELNAPPAQPFSWWPTRPGGVLYWRASRVLTDIDLTGATREVIDEFPFFSYLLGDLHPHVLAMPFGLLMAGFGLNLYLGGTRPGPRLFGWQLPMTTGEFLFAAVGLGGLGFMNLWDFPTYVALVSGAYVLRQSERRGWSWERAGDFLRLAACLGIAGGVLYLPFYIGFQSQAGGFLPSLIYSTRGVYFWVMFAPLLLPIIAWLAWSWRREGSARALVSGLGLAAGLVVGLWVLSFAFAYAITTLPGLGDLFLQSQGAAPGAIGALFVTAAVRRLTDPLTWLTLALIIALGWGLLHRRPAENEVKSANEVQAAGGGAFPLLLVLLGALLTLGPEFFYLRDQFGTRMNTIFKFYFQAWMLWGLAAAFGTALLLPRLRGLLGWVYPLGWAALMAAALAYPIFTLPYKTSSFNPSTGRTLDGDAYLARFSPDDYAGIQYLAQASPGVVVEAVGSDYSGYARVSTLSGQPAVLGWIGHVLQWRGGTQEMGSRQSDIATLYTTSNWAEAVHILQEYNVRYVYVGPLEQSSYHVSLGKFQRGLIPVYRNGLVTIFEVPAEVRAGIPPPESQITPP